MTDNTSFDHGRPVGARDPDRARMALINRTQLRLWEWGSVDARPVLCVHGAFDHGRMWDGLAPRVAELGYRVIALDVRGHGDSGRLPHGHSFSSALLDIGVLLRELGPPVGLIGHSMGGGQVLEAGSAWPSEIAWVISLDGLGPPSSVFRQDPLPETATAAIDYTVKTAARGTRLFPDRASMAAQRGAINTRLPPPWLAHLVRHGSVGVPNGFEWKWDPLFNVGAPNGFSIEVAIANYPQVDVPVLVLTGGEHDMWSEMSDDEVARRVAMLPDARHKAIADAGHYVHLEQPDAVFDQIQAFLLEVDQ